MTRHRSIQAVVNSDRFRSSSSRNADRIPGRATFSPEIRLEGSGAAVLNATDPDLSAFRERGGKLILFHGWSDAAIPAVNTINYYRSVVAKAGAKEAETFVRLYMVPGMQHCGGGPAPSLRPRRHGARRPHARYRHGAGRLGGTECRAGSDCCVQVTDEAANFSCMTR